VLHAKFLLFLSFLLVRSIFFKRFLTKITMMMMEN